MDTKVQQAWEDFLNPDVIRPVLISASIYIAGFEALKDSIIGRIRDFFCHGFDESGDKIDPRYQSKVLSRNKSPVYASLEWLKEMNAIDDADIESFERIKSCRNDLAHRLFSIIGSEFTPPDFDGKEVTEDGIIPGRLIGFQMLCDIALGDEDRSHFYIEELRKHARNG